ncbi:MAG: shikimate kinase, partial [Nitrosopumilus sp.]|nr:shikimate kinase [Nitrosopumilus sp.]
EKNQIKIMIVLRRSPYDLIKVYKNRKYSEKKTKENTGSEILGIIAHDAISRFEEKVVQINITGKTIQEGEEKVIGLISGNKESEKVDWLDLVTKNKDLRKFFVD